MAELVADRFELVDRIGSGGVGTVWRAYDHERRRYCAAKLVRRQEPEALLRVLREQSLRLSHPNVLSPYAWAAGDEVVLAASDLVHGGSLAGLIRDHGALPWRYAAEIVGQLLDGLAHVHAAGLVHRDVKPANVLLEATGQAAPHTRLADFGIAYLTDGPRLTASGFVVGTPGYLAPEALAGHPPHPSQDLFAAGVLAWQLLTGAERPEPGDAADVPPPLRTLVTTLLATDPSARPPDATTARRLLTPILAEEPLRLPAMSTDGEPVEVFDVLGPNPPALTAPNEATEALTPSKPIRPIRAAKPTVRLSPPHESPIRSNSPEKVIHTPREPGVSSPPADRLASGRPPGIGWGLPTQPSGGRQNSESRTPEGACGAERPSSPGPTTPAAQRLSALRWWLAAAGGLLLAGAAVLGFLRTGEEPTPPSQPNPTLPAPPTAGERCDWQDVAATEISEDGTPVRCVRQPDGSYLWQPA